MNILVRSMVWALTGGLFGVALCLPANVDGTVLAWIFALVWVLLYSRTQGPPTWVNAFISGLIAGGIPFFWLHETLSQLYTASPVKANLLYGAVCGTLALHFVLTHILWSGLTRIRMFSGVLAMPLAWFAIEVLVPTIVPWGGLPVTQIPFPHLIQIADIGGAPLISFAMLLIATLIIGSIRNLLESKHRESVACALVAGLVCFAIYAYSNHRLLELREKLAEAKTIRLALVQPGFNSPEDFSKERSSQNLRLLKQLSNTTLSNFPPDLIVWPERSVLFDFLDSENSVVRRGPRDPYPDLETPLLFGGQTRIANNSAEQRYHSSAFLLLPSGYMPARYDKQVLTPFLESDPFPSFSGWLPFDLGPNTLAPGEKQRPFEIEVHRLDKKAIRVATVIGFEDMTSSALLSVLRQAPAELLVSMTNDSRVSGTIPQMRHHSMGALRAVEFRSYLARVGTNGVTALVDPFGETIQEIPHTDRPGVLKTGSAKVITTHSIFLRSGATCAEWISAVIMLLALVLVLLPASRRNHQ